MNSSTAELPYKRKGVNLTSNPCTIVSFLNMSCFLYYVIICLLLAFGTESNKYAKDKQKVNVDANNLMYNAAIGRHFRMIKVQDIWNKAEKRLTGQPLADCYAELKVQDKLQYDLKWMKHKNKHKAMEKEAEVDEKLMTIAKKYDLGDFAEMNELNIPDPHIAKVVGELRSTALKKLWKQAHYSGFTDEELSKLRDEFVKHQQKLDDYEKKKEELADLEKISHNNLGSNEEVRAAHKHFKAKNKEMKEVHRELNKKFDGLSKQVNEGKMDEDFTDFRVYQLYAMAKKTAMSEEEVENFKEELKSFQQRITKHETLKEMVMQSKEYFDKFVEDGNYPKKHQDLVEKANYYNHMVKKHHNELYHRMDNMIFKHTEL